MKTCLIAKTILIGESFSPLMDGCILINNNTIDSILPKTQLPSNYTSIYDVINLGDTVLLPGLIEGHNHLGLDARMAEHLELMSSNEDVLTDIALPALVDDLLSGVTSSRCLGDKFFMDVKLKKAIEREETIGPDIFACGIGMRSASGHGYVGIPHKTTEDFRRSAKENIKMNVDHFKIFTTTGAPADDFSIPSFLDATTISAITEIGKEAGLKTAAHCIGGPSVLECAKGGVDIIEHLYCATEGDLDIIQKYNMKINLTSGIFLDETREQFCPAPFVEKAHKFRERITRCLEKIYKSNIPYTIGTDANHGLLYKELEYAVSLGASTENALKAVTTYAADLLGKKDSLGQIKEHYTANIIGVRQNPLSNVSVLRDVHFVMKQGKIYKNM